MSTDQTDHAVTLINVLQLPADQVDEFVAGWRERADFMRMQPGFLDYALHRAILPDSQFQLINVARWESKEALQAATSAVRFREQLHELHNNPGLDVTAHPGLYRVALEARA